MFFSIIWGDCLSLLRESTKRTYRLIDKLANWAWTNLQVKNTIADRTGWIIVIFSLHWAGEFSFVCFFLLGKLPTLRLGNGRSSVKQVFETGTKRKAETRSMPAQLHERGSAGDGDLETSGDGGHQPFLRGRTLLNYREIQWNVVQHVDQGRTRPVRLLDILIKSALHRLTYRSMKGKTNWISRLWKSAVLQCTRSGTTKWP